MNDHDRDIEELQTISLDELETTSGGGMLDPLFNILQPIPVLGTFTNMFKNLLPF